MRDEWANEESLLQQQAYRYSPEIHYPINTLPSSHDGVCFLKYKHTTMYFAILPRAEVPRDLDIVRHHCSEYGILRSCFGVNCSTGFLDSCLSYITTHVSASQSLPKCQQVLVYQNEISCVA